MAVPVLYFAVMKLVLLLFNLAGILTATHSLWRRTSGRSVHPDLQLAALPLFAAGAIYLEAIVLGTAGLFNPWAFSLVNLPLLWLMRREWAPLRVTAKALLGRLREGFAAGPGGAWLLTPLLLLAVLQFAAPVQDGDSLVYHLPNIRYFIDSGSTATFDPAFLCDAVAPTSYYPRGMEAICAFFMLFTAAPWPVVAFKYFLLLTAYLLACHAIRRPLLAAGLLTFLASWHVVQNDLISFKPDLLLALAATFGAAWLMAGRSPETGKPGPAAALPLAVALMLCVALKTSGLLYAALLLAVWLTADRARAWRPAALALMGGLLLAGAYFHFAAWFWKGSPIHPFGVSIGHWHVLPGMSPDIWHTAIAGNLDARVLPQFLRGLLRQTGPLGMLAVATGLGLWFADRRNRWRAHLLLTGFAAIYLLTPYSDTNVATPHAQLFSGHSIRMALPFLLLLLPAALRCAAQRVEGGWMMARLPAIVASLALLNWFWYDLVCLVFKPVNAFIQLAPVFCTCDNLRLGAGGLLLLALCLWICARRAWRGAALLLLTAIATFAINSPRHLGWLMRFKQAGAPSRSFATLASTLPRGRPVLLVSDDLGSYYTGAMKAFLFTRPDLGPVRMATREEVPPVAGADHAPVRIVCAADTEQTGVFGRVYRPVLRPPPMGKNAMPGAIRWRDDYYLVVY